MKRWIGLGVGLFFVFTAAYADNPHKNAIGKDKKMDKSLSSAFSVPQVPPGLAKHGHVPPGLAKQGKIPPGWNKDEKVKEENNAFMSYETEHYPGEPSPKKPISRPRR